MAHTASEINNTISPLRLRMLEDMTMRKLGNKTQKVYIRAVSNFSLFFGHSPDRANAEDLRLFQLHMVDQGTSNQTINVTDHGLTFLF